MKKQVKNKKLQQRSVFDSDEFNFAALGLDMSNTFTPNLQIETQNANTQLLKNQAAGNYGINKSKTPIDLSKVASQGLAIGHGAMQLGSQISSNLSTSGIGSEVEDVNDISRGDILNTNVNVATNKTNSLGQAASGALAGAKAGAALGPLGAAIGGGIGAIAGGISSIFGNKSKERAAQKAEQQ